MKIKHDDTWASFLERLLKLIWIGDYQGREAYAFGYFSNKLCKVSIVVDNQHIHLPHGRLRY